jgi:hypothetical protein
MFHFQIPARDARNKMPEDASQDAPHSASPAADPITASSSRDTPPPPATAVLRVPCPPSPRPPSIRRPTLKRGWECRRCQNTPNHANARHTLFSAKRTHPPKRQPPSPSSLCLCVSVAHPFRPRKTNPNPATRCNALQPDATRCNHPRRRKTNPPSASCLRAFVVHPQRTTDNRPRTNDPGQHLPCSCP